MMSAIRIIVLSVSTVILTCFLGAPLPQARADNVLTPMQMIEAINDHYPSIGIAELEVSQASQEIEKVQSQLGWSLNAQGGYDHDLSFIDSPVDRYTAQAGVSKKLESGSEMSITGGYTYEDNETSFSPLVPNPTERTRLDLDYRLPLAKGRDNPQFSRGLLNADAQVAIAEANLDATQNRLVEQALGLFHDAAVTRARIEEAQGAIDRARRLIDFTRENKELGLAEDKDILQAQAQLQSQISLRRNLLALWERQRISLNRLMGKPWESEFSPKLMPKQHGGDLEFDSIFKQIVDYSPEIRRQKQQIVLAESRLDLARNQREDKLDLVLSLGAVNSRGDVAGGTVDEDEIVGGIRVEFQRALDERGINAEFYQAQMQKQIAQEQMKRLEQDLRYDARALIADIQASERALESTLAHLEVEKRKWKDAMDRYQVGRTDTDQLIRFENELSQTRLQYQRERIELARKRDQLRLLKGDFSLKRGQDQ